MGLSPRQYQVLKDLVSPSVPSSLDYSTVLQVLKKHYGGQKNPRVERTKFRTTARADDETIQDFAVRLKHASRHCSFGTNLNQMLVDQLIAGVRSKCAATKLLEANEGLQLTFNKAIEIAETAILNEQSSAMYTNSARPSDKSDVHAISMKRKQRNFKVNYRPNDVPLGLINIGVW